MEANRAPGQKSAAVKGSKKGGNKRRKAINNEPGPPVEGAVLRVDAWCWDRDDIDAQASKQVSMLLCRQGSKETLR